MEISGRNKVLVINDPAISALHLLYESKYARIEYHDFLQMFVHIWSINTIEMVREEFMGEMQVLAGFFKQMKVKRVFVDQRGFYFEIDRDMQSWIDYNVNRILFEKNVEKIAFVVPPDILARMSMQSLFGHEYSSKLPTRWFDSFDQAKGWIEK